MHQQAVACQALSDMQHVGARSCNELASVLKGSHCVSSCQRHVQVRIVYAITCSLVMVVSICLICSRSTLRSSCSFFCADAYSCTSRDCRERNKYRVCAKFGKAGMAI